MSPIEEPLAIARNGVSTPLYFQRQVIEAADLNLGGASRDAELSRLRAMLHGWGVVAGLVPRRVGADVVISPGYGITPGGAELYLPEPLVVPGAFGTLLKHCGPGTQGCELPTEAPGDEARDLKITGWITVRRLDAEAAPRSGTPDGCEHPANDQHPTRRCHRVAAFLRCSLPEGHVPRPPDCTELSTYLCADPPVPLELPAPLDAAEDFLVLGRMAIEVDTPDLLSLEGRRALLPVAVLQAWLQSCICPLLEEKPEEPDRVDWRELLGRIRAAGLDAANNPERPDAVLAMYKSPIVIGGRSTVVEQLILAGINGPLEFLKSTAPAIAAATDLNRTQIKAVFLELRGLGELIIA
ncbi:hypothetical protein GCM10009715_10710 [Paeniglutamicibacter psychrophenolicus]|uniref:hypothetical protein n=1 Tax=Paeniglutamicibacter psychrophenolicus TaxID=257454 RepID=UPI0031E0AD81